MRSSLGFVSVAAGVLAFAGCGSTKGAPSAAAPSSAAGQTTTTTAAPLPGTITYNVKLAGANGSPAGAPNGSGLAVISLAPTGEICWKFSQLQGVTAPRKARIYNPGIPANRVIQGIPLGGVYSSSGCIFANSTFVGMLRPHPQRYHVSIENAQFPRGAVRGQL